MPNEESPRGGETGEEPGNGKSASEPLPHHGHTSRQDHRGEHRVPPAVAVLIAVALYYLLPSSLQLGPKYLVPALELVLLVALITTNPLRLTRETRLSRLISIGLAALVAAANLIALGLLIRQLVSTEKTDGGSLLLSALQVWTTNVIAFGLLFWEIDRGGPVARTQLPRHRIPLADMRFSHDEDHDTVTEVARGSSVEADWTPTFIDYLYVSLTNSSAFSPTDTMPLSTRLKCLMGIEATGALLTSLLVIARAVGALQS